MPGALGVFILVALFAFLAWQLRRPKGWFGLRVMGSLLNSGNRDLIDSVLKVAAPTTGQQVLDIGFGGGYSLQRLGPLVAPARVAGIELSEAMINAVRAHSGGEFDLIQADATRLPLPTATFNLIVSVNTIYFWSEPARVFAEIHRVLNTGGRLVLGYRNGFLFWGSPLTWLGFVPRSDRHIRHLMEGAGFVTQLSKPRYGERVLVGLKPATPMP